MDGCTELGRRMQSEICIHNSFLAGVCIELAYFCEAMQVVCRSKNVCSF